MLECMSECEEYTLGETRRTDFSEPLLKDMTDLDRREDFNGGSKVAHGVHRREC